MYSDSDILIAVKKKKIKILPFNEKNLQPDSYKIHLDNEIAVPKRGLINPMKHRDYTENYMTKHADGYILSPGRFILARTSEKVSVPKDLACFVNGRSGLARLGLSVVQTASFVHAGHGVPHPRKIVLELLNAGPFDIVLSKDMPIGELSFFELKTPARRAYDSFGRYGRRKNKDDLTPMKE